MATVVLMGVSGCGKSTVGRAAAEVLGARVCFEDGDDQHDAASKAKMKGGQPLTEVDRDGWLDRLAARVAAFVHGERVLLLACSALRKGHRDRLRAPGGVVRFVFLHGERDLLLPRVHARAAEGVHFMPAGLLGSQFETLEDPSAEDGVWRVELAGRGVGDVVGEVVRRVREEFFGNDS